MGTPVQITVTVDSTGAVTGFQQIGTSATSMGQQVSTSGLKGQAAIDALTKQWEAEQKMVAQVNARIKENAAAMAAANAEVAKASTLFQGLANDQTKASVSGRLFESTLGLSNRALNQVAARSALLGPLMAGAFPLAIIAGVAPMLVKIGEEIVNITNDWGGYTKAVQQIRAETVKASTDAFLNPQTIEFAQAHLNEINKQIGVLAKAQTIETSRRDLAAEQTTLEGKITAFLLSDTINSAASASLQAKELEVGEKRITLLERVSVLNKQITDEIARAQESTDLIGKSGFSKIAQQHINSLADIKREFKVDPTDDPSVIGMKNQRAADAVIAANNRATAEVMELRRQEAMETIKLNDQVTENSLAGIARIKQEEMDRMKETLADDVQKMGLTAAEVQRTAKYQAQIARIHQETSDKISAYDRAQDENVRALQDAAVKSALTGDAAIIQSGQKEKEAQGERLAKGLQDVQHYNAAIVQINIDTANKIRTLHEAQDQQDAADLAARTLEISKLKDDQMNAQSAAALAALPPWQKAYQQIYDAENSALNKILKDQETLRDKYAGDAAVLAQIDTTAQAERVRVYAEANERISAENQHLTEQLGSDLQSAFDDMTNGNIGKRVLANMEKFFFQIAAQWIISLNIMKSAFGQLAGIALFGPGSTGASVFGGGGGSSALSLIGNVLGLGGGGGGASTQSAQSAASTAGSAALTIPGLTPGGGLSSAIAGTGATPGGGLLPSASNALTTSTMADALGGVGKLGSGAASAAAGAKSAVGISSLGNNLAGLGGLGLAMLGGALGGKTGQVGSLLMGLLVSGKLAPVLSSLYGTLGLAGTGSLVGGLTGGLIGFGVGQGHGGLLGSLAGAGSGALSGFLVGGPVGAIVGGIIGLLGGIFGGIFGGSKRKKQANALADNTLLPDITQISTGFDGFQIDSSSAIQQLEQLRSDSQKQLSSLQSQGKDVFSKKVSPAIDAAEAHIRDTQAERDRRSSLQFGPPQFETGGMFLTRGGNTGLAMLHDGEAVINRTGTKKNLNAIAAMNAGKTVGGNHIEVHIHPHTFDRAYVQSPQFEDDITNALQRSRFEGRF
jgi:hypothetical protein